MNHLDRPMDIPLERQWCILKDECILQCSLQSRARDSIAHFLSWSVGRSVGWSVGNTLIFSAFKRFLSHYRSRPNARLAIFIATLAQPHATSVAVCPPLLLINWLTLYNSGTILTPYKVKPRSNGYKSNVNPPIMDLKTWSPFF